MKKKILAVISMVLAITMLSAVFVTAFASYSDENDYGEYYFYVGDVNMDYILNVADARRTLRVAIGLDVFVPQPSWVGSYDRVLGDANFDGVVKTNDARLILLIALRMMTVTELYEMVRVRQEQEALNRPTVAPTTEAPAEKKTIDSYFLKGKVVTATGKQNIEVAFKGDDYYFYSDTISDTYAIMKKGNENFIINHDEGYFYKSGGAIDFASQFTKALRDLYSVELRDFTDLSGVETKKDGDITIADFGSMKYYINAENSLVKIEQLVAGVVVVTIEIETFSTDEARIEKAFGVMKGYDEQSLLDFSEAFNFEI
ncbi:MAG TPA: hypothetical protein GXZ23_02125 [Clostridiales bacterium]|nr:hypothetical protein [Clostridiales bacterium]